MHRRGAGDEEGEVTATAAASNDVDAFRPKRLGCGIPIPIPSRPAAEISSNQPEQRAIRREIECSSDADVVTPVSQRR
jgi:hypothetical protein